MSAMLRMIPIEHIKGDPRMFTRIVLRGIGGKIVAVRALLDTGADGIFISPKAAKACHASFGRGMHSISHGRSKAKDLPAGVWVIVRAGEEIIQTKAIVSIVYPWMPDRPGSKIDAIIGMKWMSEHGVVIDTRRKTAQVVRRRKERK